MVQAVVEISPDANQILNIVKAKCGFKTKSEAIEFVALKYGEDILEPELRPEYIEKLTKIEKEKSIKIGKTEDLKKRYSAES